MNAKAPMMMDSNFKPGFKTDLHIKDLANAMDTGHGIGSPLPLTASVREMMETLHADGFGGDDHSALARYYAKVSGTKIGE
jgi:2-hydroxy-3-oxopropionate reductase